MKVLVFETGGGNYALPAETVRQVDEVMPTTPLPFVPDYVEGLTAIGGRVLPQISLAARLGLPFRDAGGELIVVSTHGNECVCRIGRTRRMLEVDENDLVVVGRDAVEDEGEGTEEEGSVPAARVVVGEFLLDGEPVLLLRAETLGLDGVPAHKPAGLGTVLLGEAETVAANGTNAATADDLACLVVMVGAERYAFPLEGVAEVYADGNLTPVPNAPPFVAGISVLRGMPRLVVSLARLLGLPCGHTPTQMVAATAQGMSLVFQCDALAGIRRFGGSRREGAGDKTGYIDSYLIGDDGSVTGLLALDGVVPEDAAERLRRYLPQADGRKGGRVSAQCEETRRMLLVRTGREICGVDIDRVERVAGYVPPTEVPGTGGLLAGMADIAGRVLPTADLGAAFGSPLKGSASAYVVVRTSRVDGFGAWALAVGALERLTDVAVSSMRTAAGSASGLVAGVGRVGERLVSLLDVDALEARASEAATEDLVA